MAQKEKLIENGVETIHFTSHVQQDYSLCGQDLAGDQFLGWDEAAATKEKVNCLNCIAIVEYCKAIKKSEYSPAPPTGA